MKDKKKKYKYLLGGSLAAFLTILLVVVYILFLKKSKTGRKYCNLSDRHLLYNKMYFLQNGYYAVETDEEKIKLQTNLIERLSRDGEIETEEAVSTYTDLFKTTEHTNSLRYFELMKKLIDSKKITEQTAVDTLKHPLNYFAGKFDVISNIKKDVQYKIVGTHGHVLIELDFVDYGVVTLGGGLDFIMIPDPFIERWCAMGDLSFLWKPTVTFEDSLTEAQASFLKNDILTINNAYLSTQYAYGYVTEGFAFKNRDFKFCKFQPSDLGSIKVTLSKEDKEGVVSTNCGTIITLFLEKGSNKAIKFAKSGLPWYFRQMAYALPIE